MRILVAMSLLLPALAFAPSAQACTPTPLVTVGGPSYPSDGLYLAEGCYWWTGTPTALVEVQLLAGVPGVCQPVPAVYVLGQPVPGTGTTHCTPTVPPGVGVSEGVSPGPYDDVGVAACSGGWCPVVSTYWLNWACASAVGDPGWQEIPGVARVRVSCATF